MDTLDAIGDPTRRRIVELVAIGPMNAGTIAGHFAMTRPAVSQHLGVLVEAGTLRVRRTGTQRIYELNPAALDKVNDWLSAQATRWRASLDALESALDEGKV